MSLYIKKPQTLTDLRHFVLFLLGYYNSTRGQTMSVDKLLHSYDKATPDKGKSEKAPPKNQ